MDFGKSVLFILFSLNSAFDAVHHAVLLNCLSLDAGIRDSALQWFASFLKEGFLSVKIGRQKSSLPLLPSPVNYIKVPSSCQLSFFFSMFLLGSIFQKFNISYHSYADDT